MLQIQLTIVHRVESNDWVLGLRALIVYIVEGSGHQASIYIRVLRVHRNGSYKHNSIQNRKKLHLDSTTTSDKQK